MKEQYEMEQLKAVEEMEREHEVEEQAEKIRNLEQRLQQMEEEYQKGKHAIEIVNDMHDKGHLSFTEDGQVNIIGNIHEQSEMSEQIWNKNV